MSIKKRIMLFVSTFLIFSSLGIFSVYANTPDDLTIIDATKDSHSQDISPLGEASCVYSPTGYCEAFARGRGVLYRGSASSHTLVYSNGCAWQCKYCYTVIITQGEAAQGMPIGYYATYNPGSATAVNGTVLYTNDIFYTSSSKLPGIHFRYN